MPFVVSHLGSALAALPPQGSIATIWELTLKGGPVMIPIALCSLAAMTIAVERLVSLRRRRVLPSALVGEVRSALESGPSAALARCREDGSAAARIFAAGLTRWSRSRSDVEKAMTETGLHEIALLRKHLRSLGALVAISPLLGLLGTIFGMITAFRTVALSAEALGRTELLAGGIYEAMVTTAAGLLVAIPTLLVQHAFAGRVDRWELELDLAARALLDAHGSERPIALPPDSLAESAAPERATHRPHEHSLLTPNAA